MRVLCYNIEEGGGERCSRLVAAINRLDADIAILCELNGWPSGREVKGLRGWLTVNEGSATGYRVGILTRHEPQCGEQLNDDLFHGALKVVYNGITIMAAHLHPFDEGVRIREARRLGELCRATKGPLILGGDLNSLPEGPDRSGATSVLRHSGLADPLLKKADAYTLRTRRSLDDPEWRFDYLLSRRINWTSMEVFRQPVFSDLSDHWPVWGYW